MVKHFCEECKNKLETNKCYTKVNNIVKIV